MLFDSPSSTAYATRRPSGEIAGSQSRLSLVSFSSTGSMEAAERSTAAPVTGNPIAHEDALGAVEPERSELVSDACACGWHRSELVQKKLIGLLKTRAADTPTLRSPF